MSSRLRLSSAPYRVGDGISLRAMTSTSPRNITTAITVMISDQISPMWFESNRIRKNAGAVNSAATVAQRVSRCHSWPAPRHAR